MRWRFVLPLLLSLGCDKSGTDTSGDADTDSDSDTDTDGGGDVGFDLTGEWEGKSLTVTRFGIDGVVGDPFFSAPATSAYMLEHFDAPPDDQLYQPYEEYPNLWIGEFAVALHEDDNGDDAHDSGEVYVGASLAFLFYAKGPIPQNEAELGCVDGWNELDFHFDGDPIFTCQDALHVPMPTNLLPVEDLTVGGTWAPSARGTVPLYGIGLAPLDNAGATWLADGAATTPWELSVSGRPPSDHFGEEATASELPISYLDKDSSGTFSDGDVEARPACKDGLPAVLTWTDPTDELDVAVQMAWEGVLPGWQALAMDDGFGVSIPATDLDALDMDGSCDPP